MKMICFECELLDVYKEDEAGYNAGNISMTRVDSEMRVVFREDDE
jgi:hypothetical protein